MFCDWAGYFFGIIHLNKNNIVSIFSYPIVTALLLLLFTLLPPPNSFFPSVKTKVSRKPPVCFLVPPK